MDMKDLRMRIDAINKEMLALFEERMDISVEIARVKKEQGLPVRDPAREAAILDEIRTLSKRYPDDAVTLFETLFALSRGLQEKENQSL